MSGFPLDLVAPQGARRIDAVHALDVPGAEGRLTVLPGHAPMACLLRSGTVVVRAGDQETRIEVREGTLIVEPGRVCLLLPGGHTPA